jgi:hypothetical protein
MQSGNIKFRVTDDERKSFFDAARKADMTVSALLRRAGRAFATGRIASRSVLDDLVAIRSAANVLAAVADNPKADPAEVALIAKNTADALREIAARHLAIVK